MRSCQTQERRDATTNRVWDMVLADACLGTVFGAIGGLIVVCVNVPLFWPIEVRRLDGSTLSFIYLGLFSIACGSFLGTVIGATGRRKVLLATLLGFVAGMLIGLATKRNVGILDQFYAGWGQEMGGAIIGMIVGIALAFRAKVGALIGGFTGLTVICLFWVIDPPSAHPSVVGFLFFVFPFLIFGAILGMAIQLAGHWVAAVITLWGLFGGVGIGLANAPRSHVPMWLLLCGGVGALGGCAVGSALAHVLKKRKRNASLQREARQSDQA